MEEDDSSVKKAAAGAAERVDVNNEFDNFARELFDVEPPLGEILVIFFYFKLVHLIKTFSNYLTKLNIFKGLKFTNVSLLKM